MISVCVKNNQWGEGSSLKGQDRKESHKYVDQDNGDNQVEVLSKYDQYLASLK